MYVSFFHFCGLDASASVRVIKNFSIKDHGSPYPLPVKGTAKLGKKRWPANCLLILHRKISVAQLVSFGILKGGISSQELKIAPDPSGSRIIFQDIQGAAG